MQGLWVELREVLTTGGDTTFVAIMVAVIFLALLLIIGVAVFIIRMYTPRGRIDLLLDSGSAERATNPWVSRIVILAVVLLFIGGVTWYAERPSSCASCHTASAYAENLSASVHVDIGCMQCHRQSGALARVRDGVRYGGWLWSHYIDQTAVEPGQGAFVDSRSCLSCHREILRETITAGSVRVRHEDFIDEGESCTDCHGTVGHAAARGIQAQAVMNSCLRCHNEVDASAGCDVCHVEDVGVRVATERGGRLGTVGLRDTSNCYACHEEAPCTSCHGVVMPHPEGWSNPAPQGLQGSRFISGPGSAFEPGTHARDGFASREVCWRCHEGRGQDFEPSQPGCWCHGELGNYHGGPAWIREHGPQATGQKTGASSNCGMCHGPPEVFCTWCHPASYGERYAPQMGPDQYTPTSGWGVGDPRDP